VWLRPGPQRPEPYHCLRPQWSISLMVPCHCSQDGHTWGTGSSWPLKWTGRVGNGRGALAGAAGSPHSPGPSLGWAFGDCRHRAVTTPCVLLTYFCSQLRVSAQDLAEASCERGREWSRVHAGQRPRMQQWTVGASGEMATDDLPHSKLLCHNR
jgi:hypothetical protein